MEVGSNEPILFMDAVRPTQATIIAYGWIRRGKTKHVRTKASRTRLNMISDIQVSHIDEAITSPYDTINVDAIFNFMAKLRSHYGSKTIHLILDQSGYHRAEKVKENAEKFKIKLHFLSSCSPNLNPIERLWKVMNDKVKNNQYFKCAKDFKQAINDFFENVLASIGRMLNDKINDNFQLLKT